MRIALPVWQEKLSPVFDTATNLVIADCESGREISRKKEKLTTESTLIERASKLANLDVEVLLCGAISNPLANLVMSYKIKVVPFLTGEVNTIIEAYLSDGLDEPMFLMPGRGCGCRRRRRHFKRGRQ